MKSVFTIILIIITQLLAGQTYQKEISSKKISPGLLSFLSRKSDEVTNEGYIIVVSSISGFKESILKNKAPCTVIAENATYNIVTVKASRDCLTNILLPLPEVIFAGIYSHGKEELKVFNVDQAINKINYIHNKYPDSDGRGLIVSIKENMFDTADLDLAGRYFFTPNASGTISYHASVMATIIGGEGNSSVAGMGIAPSVKLSSSSFLSLLPDNDTIFKNNNILVQNHSYGTVVESYYGPEAKAYDIQTGKLPQLIHVFSSGNSGDQHSQEGPYKGINGYANLTGNFKSAKNAIVVGATNSFNLVSSLSSKGPTSDGRVKPEVVAYGDDGSSTASAIVSGIALLLQNSYRNIYGVIPSAALVKAILINGADDTGSPGIDFATGYGSVNAKTAMEHISKNTFFEGAVNSGNKKTFDITLPPHTNKLKVTLVWNDSASDINAGRALINDLDLKVTNTITAKTYLPWVLNTYPQIDSLQKPPERKRDTLNNVEQITIDSPSAGRYTIEVNGYNLVSQIQYFSLAYELQSTNEFDFTYPLKKDNLISGANNMIRWQTSISGKGILQFSLNNGSSWQTIDSSVELDKQWYNWPTPAIFHLAQIRIISDTNVITSDIFSISKPIALNTGFDCMNNFMLSWNAIPGISFYRIYSISNQKLEEIALTSDTAVVYNKQNQHSLLYSIAPALTSSRFGVRSDTYNYSSQNIYCYIKSFYGILTNDQAVLSLQLGSILGISKIYIQKMKAAGYADISQITQLTSLTYSFTDSMTLPGINNYRIKTILASGDIIYSDPTAVYSFKRSNIIIYPNPVSMGKSILVVSSQNNDNTLFTLYNTLGSQVSQYKLQNAFTLIETGYLPKGIYYYYVKSKDVTLGAGKLVVY